jgi:hypothetical protein
MYSVAHSLHVECKVSFAGSELDWSRILCFQWASTGNENAIHCPKYMLKHRLSLLGHKPQCTFPTGFFPKLQHNWQSSNEADQNSPQLLKEVCFTDHENDHEVEVGRSSTPLQCHQHPTLGLDGASCQVGSLHLVPVEVICNHCKQSLHVRKLHAKTA